MIHFLFELFFYQDIVLDLIKERILKAKAEGKVPGCLIDGYPRELDQGLQFEKDVNITFSDQADISNKSY